MRVLWRVFDRMRLATGRVKLFCGAGTPALLVLLSVLVLFFWYSPGSLIAAEPAKKVNIEELALDPEFQPVPGIYYYDVFINRLRVGKATISVERDDQYYTIKVAAKSRKMVNSIYKVRYRGEVSMTTDPIRPMSADIEQQAGDKSRQISIDFPDTNRVDVTETKLKKGVEVRQKEYSLESQNFIVDPFSAIFLVRSLDWELGMAEVFDVFTGKRQYELRLYCRAETTIEIQGQPRKVWEIQPRAFSVTDPKKEKMSDFLLYLSMDEQREILMISGRPKAGTMNATLRKFTPLP